MRAIPLLWHIGDRRLISLRGRPRLGTARSSPTARLFVHFRSVGISESAVGFYIAARVRAL